MMKERFLEPLLITNRDSMADMIVSKRMPPKVSYTFLSSLTDEQIKDLGHSIFWLYPSKIHHQIANKRHDNEDYSFVDDYRSEYGLNSKYTTAEKVRGIRLNERLSDNPNLTPDEFIKMYPSK